MSNVTCPVSGSASISTQASLADSRTCGLTTMQDSHVSLERCSDIQRHFWAVGKPVLNTSNPTWACALTVSLSLSLSHTHTHTHTHTHSHFVPDTQTYSVIATLSRQVLTDIHTITITQVPDPRHAWSHSHTDPHTVETTDTENSLRKATGLHIIST